jgi:hypothetical protein
MAQAKLFSLLMSSRVFHKYMVKNESYQTSSAHGFSCYHYPPEHVCQIFSHLDHV